MKLKKIFLIPAMTLVLPFASFASDIPAVVTQAYEHMMPQPRYVYTSDISVSKEVNGTKATCRLSFTGERNFTKLTGTLTLYKYNSSGRKTKIQSWSVNETKQSFILSKTATVGANDDLVLVFSGKAYSGNSAEPVSASN